MLHANNVKNEPKRLINSFSSNKPKSAVGKVNIRHSAKNFRYLGFSLQVLFIKIRFNMLVIP